MAAALSAPSQSSSKRQRIDDEATDEDLLVPYALARESGRAWTPRELANAGPEARQQAFACPCGTPVTFRDGNTRRPHFAHGQNTRACSYFDGSYRRKYGNGESETHIKAKHLFGDPAFRGRARLRKLCAAPHGGKHLVGEVQIDTEWNYHAEYVIKEAGIKCDVAFVDESSQLKLIIEVVHTHRTQGDKRAWLVGRGHMFQYVEVDAEETLRQREGSGTANITILDSSIGAEVCGHCRDEGHAPLPRGTWTCLSATPGDMLFLGDRAALAVDEYAAVGSYMLRFLTALPPEAFRMTDCYVSDGHFVYRCDGTKIAKGKVDVPGSERWPRTEFFDNRPPRASSITACPSSRLRIVQKGAGSGKTYDSVQLLCSPDYSSKTTFLYLTKVHTAKEVIRDEFWDQLRRGALALCFGDGWGEPFQLEMDWCNEIRRCKSLRGDTIVEAGTGGRSPKYHIKYTPTGSSRTVSILIGTIDSFVWALDKCLDKTSLQRCAAIAPGELHAQRVQEAAQPGVFNRNMLSYGKHNVDLNETCLVNVDEVQDLPTMYVDLFIKIVRGTRVDISVVGDKLQSIWHEENIFTYLEQDQPVPNVIIERPRTENIVKRFHNPALSEFVNNAVHFEKFGLPRIQDICASSLCSFSHARKEVELFRTDINEEGLATDEVPVRISNLCKRLQKYITAEREENPLYNPSNFCIVTPFVNSSTAKREWTTVCTFLEDLWTRLLGQAPVDKKRPYVFWHKSEDGAKPINLQDSADCMRILSIHAAKGTGCSVVFLLGCSESALKYGILGRTKGLKYESKINVALTRQKRSLYVEIPGTEDDFTGRFQHSGRDLALQPDLRPLLGGNSWTAELVVDAIWERLDAHKACENIDLTLATDAAMLSGQDSDLVTSDGANMLVDWGDHMLRGALLFWHTLLGIAALEQDGHARLEKALTTFFRRPVQKLQAREWVKQLWKTHRLYIDKKLQVADAQPIPILELPAEHQFHAMSEYMKRKVESLQQSFRSNNGSGTPFARVLKLTLAGEDDIETVVNVLIFHIYLGLSLGNPECPSPHFYKLVGSLLSPEATADEQDKLRKFYAKTSVIQQRCQTLRSRWPVHSMHWQLNDYVKFGWRQGREPFKFWQRLEFHGFHFDEETSLGRSLLVVLQPHLDECNVRRTLMKAAMTHFFTTQQKDHPKAKDCMDWQAVSAVVSLNSQPRLFGKVDGMSDSVDVEWDCAQHTAKLAEILMRAVLSMFEDKHEKLEGILTKMRKPRDVRRLKERIEKLKGPPLAYHMSEFLTAFEDRLNGDRGTPHRGILEDLRSRCERKVRKALGEASDDSDDDNEGESEQDAE